LMTGRYHGAPLPKHLPLPINRTHFDRWLSLFRQTAGDTCPPEGALWVIERAERIAEAFQTNMLVAAERQAGLTPARLRQ